MLAKKYRLPWSAKFHNARSFSTPQLLIKIQQNKLMISRFGIVVSKKIDKRAVRRNRIRRLMYAVINELLGQTKSGFDILFIVKKTVVGNKRNDFYAEIEEGLIRQGLLK